MTSRSVDGELDRRARVQHAIVHASHLLAPQGPITKFIHHNTLHGLQHLPFEDALAEGERLLGGRAHLPNSRFRAIFSTGRITPADLDAALRSTEARSISAGKRELPLGELRRAAMLHALEPITAAELDWRLHEESLDEALWLACVHALGAGPRKDEPAPAISRQRLDEILAHAGGSTDRNVARLARVLADPHAGDDGIAAARGIVELLHLGDRFPELAKRPAPARAHTALVVDGERTLSAILESLGGAPLVEQLNDTLIALCSAFLDDGVAAWRMPGRSQGLYAAWRSVSPDAGVLPLLPVDAVIAALEQMAIPADAWDAYLRSAILELPGWAGMIQWLAEHPEHPLQQAAPVELIELVAIRLQLEARLVAEETRTRFGVDGRADAILAHFARRPGELAVRLALHDGSLDGADTHDARLLSDHGGPVDAWDSLAARIPAPGARTPWQHAWPLFRLCQELAIPCDAVTTESARALSEALEAFPASAHGPIWQLAYEHHYRQELVDAVAANKARGTWRPEGRPSAQVAFCIDEREEAYRRHLEEIDPSVETLAAAGFYGVAIRYHALHGFQPDDLCPVVVNPAHEVTEIAAEPALVEKQATRRAWWGGLFRFFWGGAGEQASAAPAWLLTAPVVGVDLLGRMFAPLGWHGVTRRIREAVLPPLVTRLPLDARERGGHALQRGFSVVEQADRVEGTLRAMGLLDRFARVVLLCAHGSESVNNPHESAYDCGACSGRPGGPNARAFAAMANNAAVRALLGTRAIQIPDDTWFIGSEHNTCSEEVKFFDVDLIPASHQADFERIRHALHEAGRRSAHERCRRFASAPQDGSLDEAAHLIEERAFDFSQVRPELCHATNASAFVGRRAITRGLFLDRRAFLVSYDPNTDATGEVLEKILLAVGPVGAGINLEYYFSSVDNVRYGCDTKLPHNISGLIGVMEGLRSDLRTGLSLQMVEPHEPVRLQIFVEASTERLGMIYGRQPGLRELIGNGWVHLIAVDPDTAVCRLFDGAGFVECTPSGRPVPTVTTSRERYLGQSGCVPPALIRAGGGSHV